MRNNTELEAQCAAIIDKFTPEQRAELDRARRQDPEYKKVLLEQLEAQEIVIAEMERVIDEK